MAIYRGKFWRSSLTTTNEDIVHALNKCFSMFTPTLATVYENQQFNPELLTPHLRIWHLPAETSVVSLGVTGYNQYTGIFQVSCFYPQGFGWNDAKVMAGKVCSHFYRGRQITYNNIVVEVRRSWPDPGIAEDEYYHVPVSILYWCFDNTL